MALRIVTSELTLSPFHGKNRVKDTFWQDLISVHHFIHIPYVSSARGVGYILAYLK